MGEWVTTEIVGRVGCITLNRPHALNALNLAMVRDLTAILLQWQSDEAVGCVAIRGRNRHGPFGAFCAGGDIRFFHQAALAGNPALEDFFTEEYTLNHLIHNYSKPYIAFMDGIIMGGGMGISQGASHRLVTAHTKMAMPETIIGLFPDVGGGYFLSRCPGRIGEWLALTGEMMDGAAAVAVGLADTYVDAAQLSTAWEALGSLSSHDTQSIDAWLATFSIAAPVHSVRATAQIDPYFEHDSVAQIVQALEADADAWAQATAATLRKRSPLMLHVVLEQIRRARGMSLADDLRMERTLVRHCFFNTLLERSGIHSETVEGIRALAVDKDNAPQWNPANVEDVTEAMVASFFEPAWPDNVHPLAALK
jgi:enoyl-CoA hydratase/carnithine racemase